MSGQTTDGNEPIDMNSLWSNISGNIVAKNEYNVGIGNNGSSDTKLSIEIPTSNSSMSHGLKVKTPLPQQVRNMEYIVYLTIHR